ncbi:MAG TPA: carbon monoxide dehydrogenase subunit G [Chloroflexota bacterium]|nr:carbon monoxide dehydrogenase subunit G [Chloroflexota bacterium]
MRFQGDVTIEAPRERAWAFLTDPRQVTQCAPDVQSLNVLDDQRFTVVVRAGVGAVKGTFTFAVMWLERIAPEHARVQARGKVPGSAVDMMTVMTLGDAGEGRTLLHWEADVSVKGVIASVGGRLIQGAADKVTQQLFACVKSKLEAPASATATAWPD